MEAAESCGEDLEQRLLQVGLDEWRADRVDRAVIDVRFEVDRRDVDAHEMVVGAAVVRLELGGERFSFRRVHRRPGT